MLPVERGCGARARSTSAPADDYRAHGGYHAGTPSDVWVPTACIVVEVLSPDDETFQKFDFYFAEGVQELVVADPASWSLRWWAR